MVANVFGLGLPDYGLKAEHRRYQIVVVRIQPNLTECTVIYSTRRQARDRYIYYIQGQERRGDQRNGVNIVGLWVLDGNSSIAILQLTIAKNMDR